MSIAYICMEMGLQSNMKLYAGGLGVLAGDTLKEAADQGKEVIGVSLLYHYGYFKQSFDLTNHQQIESSDTWDITKYLQDTETKIKIYLRNSVVAVKIWKYLIKGLNSTNPVYFLDTNLEENDQEIRQICHNLYTKDEKTRLMQELVLGIGSVLALEALGHKIDKYHLNESSTCFALTELEKRFSDQSQLKSKIVFTTHTPVPHGHRIYTKSILEQVISEKDFSIIQNHLETDKISLHTTKYCMRLACFINAVSKKHQQITKKMFPEFKINSITNGIHPDTWITDNSKTIFDGYLAGWRQDASNFRNALNISDEDILEMHHKNKLDLISFIKKSVNISLDPNIFTIGFGRRVDPYKRHDLILGDIIGLQKIVERWGGLQIVFAGKAYPGTGKTESSLGKTIRIAQSNFGNLKIVYLPDYSMDISQKMVSGVDIWLNNPISPMEASGTSGMKAAINGVPNFSTLDGWWTEGCVEGQTGWKIPEFNNQNDEVAKIYNILEEIILPIYKLDTKQWLRICKQAISVNGSYFNSKRLLEEYFLNAYQN
jgi:glycogen phosphorylase